MCDQRIVSAVNNARPGINKYLAIMALLHDVDVSKDEHFQKLYKGFYRVRQKPPAWYATYFSVLEKAKKGRPSFSYVLNQLKIQIGNNAYEPSFASKLVASADPWRPVWDVHVLRNTGHTPPAYNSSSKHADATSAYSSIVNWYDQFMPSAKARRYISIFNDSVNEYYKITDIKKIDFILWQLRDEEASSDCI